MSAAYRELVGQPHGQLIVGRGDASDPFGIAVAYRRQNAGPLAVN